MRTFISVLSSLTRLLQPLPMASCSTILRASFSSKLFEHFQNNFYSTMLIPCCTCPPSSVHHCLNPQFLHDASTISPHKLLDNHISSNLNTFLRGRFSRPKDSSAKVHGPKKCKIDELSLYLGTLGTSC